MAELKTKQTKSSVKDFLSAIQSEQIRKDSLQVAALMEKATQSKPKMWGKNIVGFGATTLKYANGSERDWMRLAFSPRAKHITLYLPIFKGRKEIEATLGKYASSKACLHIKKLADVHIPTLNKLIKESAKYDDCGCKS
jgi:hypothetical protein